MEFLFKMQFDFPVVFVGGAPRSGTTMLHALLCTSPNVNDYVAECRYFTTLLEPLSTALKQYKFYSQFYFDSEANLLRYHATLLSKVLCDMRSHLGSPAILALKDPYITPQIPFLVQINEAIRSLVVFRDHRDCLASIVRAERKGGVVVDEERFMRICREYNGIYTSLIGQYSVLSGRVVLIRYEDLVVGDCSDLFQRVGVEGVDVAKLWSSSKTDVSHYADHNYYSDLFGKPIDKQRIGYYRDVLSDRMLEIADEECAATNVRLNDIHSRQ